MSIQSPSRRKFFKTAGITAAAGTVTCLGLGYAATLSPAVDLPKINSGAENTMNKRILVTYATRAGSTAEIATAIAENLTQRGLAVDVIPVKEKPQLSNYRAVVVGSAVRIGGWLPEAVDYIKNNQAALQQLPVALFTVHTLTLGESEAERAARLAYLKNVQGLIRPVDLAFFAGVINPDKLSFLDRLMIQMVKSPVGDFREWQKVRAWAGALAVA